MLFKKIFVFLLLFFGTVFIGAQDNLPVFPEQLEQRKEIKKLIVVTLDRQLLAYYENGKLISCYPISSGKKGRSTPVGEFKIVNKTPNGFSKKYKSPMPWTMALNELYAVHAGELPGYPDSHGCIRLSNENAQELYNWAEIGTKVLIIGSLGILKK